MEIASCRDDDQSVGGERTRRPLEHDRSRATLDQRHRRRRDRVLRVGEQVTVALRFFHVEAPDVDHADLRQPRQFRPRPAGGRRRQYLEHGLQLVEDRDHQLPVAPEEVLQRTPLARLEQHREITRTGKECRQRDAEQRVGRIGLGADRPLRAALRHQPPAMGLDGDIRRQLELRLRTAAVAHPEDRIEEARLVDEPDRFGTLRAVDGRPQAHAFGRRLDQHRRRIDIRSAPPQPDRPRIARRRRHVLAVGARQQQRVPVQPVGAALGLRQIEAVANEGFGWDVELAQHGRIAAPARQTEDCQIVRARQRRRAMPHPVLLFLLRQGVDIQDDLPARLLRAEAVERRPPPQAARVLGILPEIVEMPSATHDERNVVWPVQNGRQGIPVPGKASIAEFRQRGAVLRLDPGQRAGALDVLEPQMGIVVGSGDRRPGIHRHEHEAPRGRAGARNYHAQRFGVNLESAGNHHTFVPFFRSAQWMHGFGLFLCAVCAAKVPPVNSRFASAAAWPAPRGKKLLSTGGQDFSPSPSLRARSCSWSARTALCCRTPVPCSPCSANSHAKSLSSHARRDASTNSMKSAPASSTSTAAHP